ncbi:MAG TPA: sensor domain-containing diguanylate cyclase [Spirochaetia bacterium]|nr:sensor domain-containing diguanylate cyclase [Spirochaetia bacterium]
MVEPNGIVPLDLVEQEPDLRGVVAHLYRSLNSILARIAEREQVLYAQIRELEEKGQILSRECSRERTLVQRFQEFAAMLELIFSLSTEEQIGAAVVSFLHRIYPFATVRLISAASSRTRMKVMACSEGLAFSDRTCTMTPLECMAIKMGKIVERRLAKDKFICGELTSLKEVAGHVCVPLMAEGTIFGNVSLFFPGPEAPFDREDQELIGLFAAHIALAIWNNRLMRMVKKDSLTDQLTGLPNRRFLIEAVQREIDRAGRYGSGFTLAMVDIDHFKRINDQFGHDEGDRVLIFLAETTRQSLRKADVAARYGGEEFLFLLPQTGLAACRGVVERVNHQFCQGTLNPVFKAHGITFSAGLVEYPADGRDVGELIKKADTRLYRAKQLGRNRIVGGEEVQLEFETGELSTTPT